MDVKSEIGEMLKTLGGGEEIKEEEIKEEKEEEEVKVEEEEEVVKEEEETEEKPEEKEEEVKEDEEKEEEVPDEKDKVIEDLRAKLAEKEIVKVPEPEPEPEPESIKFEDQDFIGELDLEEVVRDPKEFNKLLNTIYQKAVTDTRQILGEGVLRSIPDIVKTNIAVMTNLKRASDKFYEDNKDLVPFKGAVANVFEETASKNPDKKYDEILKEVGDEVRKRLGMKKEAVKKDANDEEKPPRLPRKKGTPGEIKDEKPDTSSLQGDISKMNETLGR